jgi:hypothetical protein
MKIISFSQIICLILSYTQTTSAGVDFIYENDDINLLDPTTINDGYDVNVPFFMPSIIPIEWDANMKVLPFCVETNGIPVNKKLIESAIDNVNLYLYSGNIETTALYLYVNEYTNTSCSDDSLKIKLVKNNSVKKAPGYCSRKFISGTVDNPKALYIGCDITLNTCILQSSATFYNVLLHELLHVVGLDHPENRDDSVMSYGVVAKDRTLKNIRQDTEYISVTKTDMENIKAIVIRDFPDASLPVISNIPDEISFGPYIPTINASSHMSGDSQYVIDKYANADECWVSSRYKENNVPKISPLSTTSPTKNPTNYNTINPTKNPTNYTTINPTKNPTNYNTINPTKNPTYPTNTERRRWRWRRNQKGKGKGKGKNKSKSKTEEENTYVDHTERNIDTQSPSVSIVRETSASSSNNFSITTHSNPNVIIEPYIHESTQRTFYLDTNVSPDVDVDVNVNALENDIHIHTEVNPDIKISGNINNFKMITNVNPVVRILSNPDLKPVTNPIQG